MPCVVLATAISLPVAHPQDGLSPLRRSVLRAYTFVFPQSQSQYHALAPCFVFGARSFTSSRVKRSPK